MDIPKIVTLAVYALTIVFVFFGFLFGLGKGLKKSVLRIIVFLAFLLITALVSQLVTKSLMTINVPFQGRTAPVSDQLLDILLENETIAGFYSSSSAFAQLFNALPIAIVNFVVFMVLVYVLGFIGWIIYLILAAIFIKKPKKLYVVKNGKTEISTEFKQVKKHRFLGGLVGALQAFILIFVTLMPITAIVSTFNDLSCSTQGNIAYAVEESGEEEQLTPTSKKIRELVPAEVFDITDAYSSTIFSKISTIGGFDKICFDSLTTIKVGNEKITLRKEINNIAKVYDNVDFLMSIDFNNLDYKTLDFDKLEKALDALFDSGLLKSLLPDVMGYALDEATSTEENQFNSAIPDEYLRFVVAVNDEFKDNKGIETIKSDVYAVFGIAKAVCQSGIIDKVVEDNVNVDEILTLAEANNRLVVNNIITNLFKSNTVKALLVEGVNYGLETLDATNDDVSIPTIDKTKVNWSAVSANFSTVVNSIFDIYGNVKTNLDCELTEISSNPQLLLNVDVDQLTQKLAVIMTKIQNSALIDSSGEDKIYNKLIYLFETTEYAKYVDMNVFKQSNTWETELSYLNTAVNGVKNSGIVAVVCEPEIDFELVIDKLASKDTVKNQTYIRQIIKPLLDSRAFAETVSGLGLGYVDNLIEQYQSQIGEGVVLGKIQGDKLSNENEKELVVAFFENLVVYAQDLSLEQLKSDAFGTIIASDLTRLGNALDSIKESELFGEYTEEDDSTNPGIYQNLIDGLASNPNFNKFADFDAASVEGFSWNEELSLIQDAITVLNTITISVDGNPKSVLSAIKDGNDLTLIFESLTTENDDIDNIVNPLCESKLMKKNLFTILNTLNSKLGEILEVEIDEIPTTANLNSEKQTIINVLKQIVDLYSTVKDGMSDDMLKTNSSEIGTLLNTLMASKNVSGIFANTYDGFMEYIDNSTYGTKVTYLLGEYENASDIDWKQILALASEALEYTSGNVSETLKTKLANLVGTVYADQDCTSIMNSLILIGNNVMAINEETETDDALTVLINAFGELEQYNSKYAKVHKVIEFIENLTGITDLSDLKSITDFTAEKNTLTTLKNQITIVEGTPTPNDITNLIGTLADSEFVVNLMDKNNITVIINEAYKPAASQYIDESITNTEMAAKIKSILVIA